jgi:hypothetical protein
VTRATQSAASRADPTGEREHRTPAGGPIVRSRARSLQVAHDVLANGGGLGCHDARRTTHRRAEIEAPRVGRHAGHGRYELLARSGPHDSIRQDEPQPIARCGARQHRAGRGPQPVERHLATYHCGRRELSRITTSAAGGVTARPLRRHEGPRGRQDYGAISAVRINSSNKWRSWRRALRRSASVR